MLRIPSTLFVYIETRDEKAFSSIIVDPIIYGEGIEGARKAIWQFAKALVNQESSYSTLDLVYLIHRRGPHSNRWVLVEQVN